MFNKGERRLIVLNDGWYEWVTWILCLGKGCRMS